MQRPDDTLYDLQRISSDFALINRNHYLLNSERNENDAEHSFSVAILCWYIVEKQQIPLDLLKILKYALAHDLVEIYAGDVSAFAEESTRNEKVKTEEQALAKMTDRLQNFPDLTNTMQEYEAKSTKEALFVWTVDKIQALVLGDLDYWRPYKDHYIPIPYASFADKYDALLRECSPYAKAVFTSVVEYSKTTYFDRPLDEK